MLGLKNVSAKQEPSKPKTFDQEAVAFAANEMARILSGSGLSSVEMAFALAAVLRGLGEAIYDKPNTETSPVFEDYKTSPSWPAALILHADQIPNIWELFATERKDPKKNIRAWHAHEERLNDGKA